MSPPADAPAEDPRDPEDPMDPARRPEPARDRAVRVVREALTDGRIRFRVDGMKVWVSIAASPEMVVDGGGARTALRRKLRSLYEGAVGGQPSDEALRAMADTLRSAADQARTESMVAAAAHAAHDGPSATATPGTTTFVREGSGDGSQADMLIQLIDEKKIGLWHTSAGDLYATTHERGRTEHRPIGSRDFKRWIQGCYFEKHQKAVRREALSDALGVLEGRAQAGEEHEIYVRIAGRGGNVYLDLCDAERRIVEISPGGWNVITDAPVRFRRPPGMLALPAPVRGGSVDDLRPLLNVPDDDAWILIAAFLLGALHPHGPYFVLVLVGEQGSGKSEASRLIVMLIDPKDVPLRRPPRDEHDLVIGARNGHVLAFNNISHLPQSLSDALASVSHDGGFSTRTLYTDDEEIRFRDRRPVVSNGIPDFVTAGDLADRSLKIMLKQFAEGKRRTEDELRAEFERVRPGVLGALCTAVAASLGNGSKIPSAGLPRMANAARWIIAAEPALGWKPGTFMRALKQASGAAAATVVDADKVATAMRAFATPGGWRGTAGELLKELTPSTVDAAKDKDWPKTPQAMASVLRRVAPSLRQCGLVVEDEGEDQSRRTRIWFIALAGGERTPTGKDGSEGSQDSEAASAGPSGAEPSVDPSPGVRPEGSEAALDPEAPSGDAEPSTVSPGGNGSDVTRCPGTSPSASSLPSLPNPEVSASSCTECGRASPYDGWHIEGCAGCGSRCPCLTCHERREAPGA